MPPRSSKHKLSNPSASKPWAENIQLVGLTLQLQPLQDSNLYPQYPIGLHAWLLDQVRQCNSTLSTYLHDGESEKPFTISALQGVSPGSIPKLSAQKLYHWTITALSQPVAAWLATWLKNPPEILELRGAPLRIVDWGLNHQNIMHPPITYQQLLEVPIPASPQIALSFTSPTSFRRRGNHFPLPVPTNLFHSYLRRWNDFADVKYDQDDVLDWVEESVVILRHHLQSVKTVAGKRGAVTGFTGSIELGLTKSALAESEYVKLFMALGRLAPYSGTGHKTTFGLGQTRLEWLATPIEPYVPSIQDLQAQRIAELTEFFAGQRKRTGGDRATNIAETWATILARREMGDSLQDIAEDLEMRYETVKTYVKLARKALKPE